MPLAHGLFAQLRRGRFGPVPPSDDEVMRAFLDGGPFVFTGPDRWNALGLGTTSLFAAPLVYNTKRSGTFDLGGRRYVLRRVAFPSASSVDPGFEDRSHRSAQFRVIYPGTHRGSLAATMKPFVLLQVGSARVTPFVERGMTSFVHEELAALGQLGDFHDNRPHAVRCVRGCARGARHG